MTDPVQAIGHPFHGGGGGSLPHVIATPAEGETDEITGHGTRLVRVGGRLTAVIDRGGVTHARLTWCDAALVDLIVGAPGAWTVVGGATTAHPLFGRAHPLWVTRGDAPVAELAALDPAAPTTWMGEVRWAAPTTIPPIFEPARLPASAGTMMLNVIAVLARDARVAALRYAGPYPTPALWRSLTTCFRPEPGADGGEDAFTADALDRSRRGAMDPIPIDVAPAPFERVWVTPRVVVQLRDGLERATIDGVGFDRSARVGRLVAIGDRPRRWAAELWLGDRPWGRVAELDDDGAVIAGPTPLPAVAGPLAGMVGQVLPPALCAALAEVVAELVAPPLARAAHAELAAARVCWGDPGPAEVVDRDGALIVHAGLWAHLGPHGLGAVARGLAIALAGPIAIRAQARLAALAPDPSPA